MPPPPQQKPAKVGLFKSKPSQQPGEDVSMRSDVTDLGRRLRTMEERYTALQGRLQLIEHNMVSHHRHLNTEIHTQISEITEVKKDLHELKDRLLMVIRDLQVSAKKEDVKILERYLNMWEPLNFVTRNEVKDIIKEILSGEKKTL